MGNIKFKRRVPLIMKALGSDVEAISAFVIERITARKIPLMETARKILIGKCVSHWEDYGLRQMREILEWEISLLYKIELTLQRASKGYANIVRLVNGKQCAHFDKVKDYLTCIGLDIWSDDKGFFTVAPRCYDVPLLRATVLRIVQTGQPD